MPILLFEDAQVTQLYPVSIGKPAFRISCGGYRLIDLVADLGQPVDVRVRPHLRAVHEADCSAWTTSAAPAPRKPDAPILMVNARLVPSAAAIAALKDALVAGRFGVVYANEGASAGGPAASAQGGQDARPPAKNGVERGPSIALAVLPPATELPPIDAQPAEMVAHVAQLGLPRLDLDLPLLDYPHDIIRYHLTTLRGNLEYRLQCGNYREIADGVFAAAGATLGQHVVTDTRNGPIVLDENAAVGPYCYISGPAHLGTGARVIEHAAIKDGVSLGHTTKIGGEIEGSVIEPFTNKQHHGFLGHSYLGSWVNLGAGTCNSDLKNTYGQVNMEYWGQRVATGMQFVGTIVGDYAKTAINTGIFTGKTVGACSMVYGFVTTNVPSFVNYARSFGQVTEAPVDVMVATQARMFARRKVSQRPCDIQLLFDMYELTRHERQLAGEPLSL
ncbi:MAG: glucose-1-phosphate thymidylyltransferase [Planctomycetia bacterium]|nr:glucose-1-phosphate thymidylyltransferase [Planctomycetia bacterium]